MSIEDNIVAALNRIAKGTNLITFDSDCVKSNRILYIGTNNFEAGKVLGQEIVKLLPDGGKMAVFVGTLAADNARQRLDEAGRGGHLARRVVDAGPRREPGRARPAHLDL